MTVKIKKCCNFKDVHWLISRERKYKQQKGRRGGNTERGGMLQKEEGDEESIKI